jgi:hypothetical protein
MARQKYDKAYFSPFSPFVFCSSVREREREKEGERNVHSYVRYDYMREFALY